MNSAELEFIESDTYLHRMTRAVEAYCDDFIEKLPPVRELRNILVPIDFSETSLEALRYAVPFAKHFEAKIILLHVVPPGPATVEGLPMIIGEQDTFGSAARQLEEIARSNIESGLSLQTLTRSGFVFDTIVSVARETCADIIILTTHGDTGLEQLFTGSTAECVERNAPCPVLVLREKDHEIVCAPRASTSVSLLSQYTCIQPKPLTSSEANTGLSRLASTFRPDPWRALGQAPRSDSEPVRTRQSSEAGVQSARSIGHSAHALPTASLALRALLGFALLAACAAQTLAVVEPTASAPKPPCCREGLPPGKYSDQSLYKLEAKWTSDVEREVKLEVLRGRPQVIALFFTKCEHSCPLIVTDMKAIDKALPRNVRGKVDFLLVSIDPERDTPDALRAFRAKHELPTERWTLLRGSPEATRELATRIGFNYQPGSPTQYAHSLLISIANVSGEIVFQQVGIGRPKEEAVAALLRLTRAERK